MELWIVLFIMFAHWWSDFVCQSNEMAMNKSTNIGWLTVHVGMYSCMMIFWTLFLVVFRYGLFNSPEVPEIFVLFPVISLIFITHWITDFITSRITSRLWKEGKTHKFFVVIGFDQWLHLVQLLIIYKVFLLN